MRASVAPYGCDAAVSVAARAAGCARRSVTLWDVHGENYGRTFMAETDETYSGEAYCVKCKEKREFDGIVHETNGRRMAKGKCPVCNTTVTRILGKKKD